MAHKRLAKEEFSYVDNYLTVWYKAIAVCPNCHDFNSIDIRDNEVDGIVRGYTCVSCKTTKFVCVLDSVQGRMARCEECKFKFVCITHPDVTDVST